MIIKLLFLHFLFIFFTFTSSFSSNFTLFGTTIINHTSIILTQHSNNCIISSNTPDSNIGRIFYKHPIRFLDSSYDSTASFFTQFTFSVIVPPPPCLSGEGIAFLITSDLNSFAYSDGFMGLPKSNDRKTPYTSFLAVEFDTKFDQDLSDINDNHVAIDLDSVVSVASVDLMKNGVNLKSGKQVTAWIEYSNPEKIIRVWVGYTQTKPENPLLETPIDLRFDRFMYVGFSAANGRGSSTHSIDSWYFKTSESVEDDAVGPGNCLICLPENLVKANNHHKAKTLLQIAIGSLVLNLILILLPGLVLYYVCVIKRGFQMQHVIEQGQNQTTPRRLELSVIRSATKGFRRINVIKQHPSATVYKANLPPYGAVVVKRFGNDFRPGGFSSQFATEIATMVASLSHKNLMQLKGWCCDETELILVYDYIANGSLDKIIQTRVIPSTLTLNFGTRLNILVGVSSALIYLHEECGRPIIHRNVTTSNIMLDVDLTPLLGDVGTAEIYERARELQHPYSGGIGYLPVEYVVSGVPTVKTDVYSFGVVVLEVASGRWTVFRDGRDGRILTDWVWGLWEEKRLLDAADPKLNGGFSDKCMEGMLMTGLICTHPNPEMRPTMKEVMQMLKGGLVPDLPATKPDVRSILIGSA